MVRHIGVLLAAFLALAVFGAAVFVYLMQDSPPVTPTNGTPVSGYRVIAYFPHDKNAFTEGLVFTDGYLFEGTGLNGKSSVRQQNLTTGEVLQSVALPQQYFGEGIAILGDRIYQLTWQSHKGFVYDLDLVPIQEFSYATEGWGLTHNGTHLIMSDGTSSLYFIDPANFSVVGQVQVKDGENAVLNLKRAEYINGEVWANVLADRPRCEDLAASDWCSVEVNFSGLLTPGLRTVGTSVQRNRLDPPADRLCHGQVWQRSLRRACAVATCSNYYLHPPACVIGETGAQAI